ncbi:hypothetical protein [Streptomyces sp. NPDC001068]|uniref:hypothetical protein n=1 Tax=Streptomyces sp. NPDC001068 TaxID=3364544 RepID=UPI0036B41EF0
MTLEPFGVDYVPPAQQDCPDCGCCSARLCERGRMNVHQCHGLTPEEFRATVSNCPCSSPWTRGTHAWRLDRIRATRYASEQPLAPAVEVVLRALAQGVEVSNMQALAPLRVTGFVAVNADRTVTVTEAGAFYLGMRSTPRFVTSVEVLSVDTRMRTARCLVVGWHLTEPVTVLLDQLLASTKLPVEELTRASLEAEANCRASAPDDVVLTRITVVPPLPDGIHDPERTLALRAVTPAGGEQA